MAAVAVANGATYATTGRGTANADGNVVPTTMSKRAARRRNRRKVAEAPSPPATGRNDAIAVAVLILAVLGFWWRAALLRGFLAHGDICYFFEPVKAYLHESLRAGRLALWSPYVFCGYPLGAEGQVATFHPLSLAISWLLPSPAAINWLVISHLLLVGISMYALARSLGMSPFGAWLAGFVMSFSGYLVARSHHVGLVCAAAWLPLIVYFVERSWRRGMLPNAVLAAFAWAMSALSGHLQTTFHISLLVVFWICWRLARGRQEDGCWRYGRAVGVVLLSFGLGAGMAAVQLLMTRDLSAIAYHGDRGSWEYVTSFSLRFEHLAGLVNPMWQGSPAFDDYSGDNYYWEYVLYIGLVPLALAAIGATGRRGWTLAGLAVAALWLAMASSNPLYRVLRFLPGFADFRVPARYLLIFTFAAALLAGQGWEAMARLRWLQRGRRAMALAGLVALLTAFNLMAFDRIVAPLGSAKVYTKPQAVSVLEREPTWGRALILPPMRVTAAWLPEGGWKANPDGWAEVRGMLAVEIPQSYRLRTIGGYPTLTNRDQVPFSEHALNLALGRGDLSLVSLIGVRHILVDPQDTRVQLPGQPVSYAEPYAIYSNDGAYPRVFGVTRVRHCRNRSEALAEVLQLAQADRLRDEAVVHEDMPELVFTPGNRVSLRFSEPRPERVVVDATAEGDALVVLNERWDPGWRAYSDGRPARLVEVDTMLMGTPLPPGEHRVEFVYRPRGLVIGRAITLGAVVLSLALIVLPVIRRRRSTNQSSNR